MLIRKLRIRILIMVFVIYIPFCYIRNCINKDYFDISTQEKLNIANCPEEYIGEEINAKEFFIFNSNIVWCNVFKSASTSILNMIGLLEGFSNQDLKQMSSLKVPLITSFRNIYGRPTIRKLKAEMAKPETKSFLVKRDPFKRLLSGYRNKIIEKPRGKYLQIAITILSTYRGKSNYKFGKTIPSFSEFVRYILDTNNNTGEIDMHWAPVVEFCSVCKVNFTHIIDFENLYEDMVKMMPENKQVLETVKSRRLNVNKIGPITDSDVLEEFGKLPPNLHHRLCQLYEKDFKVFGYSNKNCKF